MVVLRRVNIVIVNKKLTLEWSREISRVPTQTLQSQMNIHLVNYEKLCDWDVNVTVKFFKLEKGQLQLLKTDDNFGLKKSLILDTLCWFRHQKSVLIFIIAEYLWPKFVDRAKNVHYCFISPSSCLDKVYYCC